MHIRFFTRVLTGTLKGKSFRQQQALFLCVVSLFCASCNKATVLTSDVREEADFAQNWLERLRAGDYEYVYNHAGEELKADLTPEEFERFILLYPKENVKNLSLLQWQYKKFKSLKSGDFSRYDFVYEYEFENNQYAVMRILLERNENGLSVIGANITRTADSQKNINKFTLMNKNAKHYVILFFALLMPVYSLCLFVLCLCTHFPLKQKIPWLLFISVGFGAVDINWTTGALRTGLLHIHLLSAAALTNGGTWHIMFGIPVGAILFWFKRKRILAAAKNNNEVV